VIPIDPVVCIHYYKEYSENILKTMNDTEK
jgi:hypothetical protein